VALAKGMISRGRVLEITGAGGMPIYGLYYAPINGLWQAPRDARPPAIVMAHGGPTASADRGLKLKIQYWTSRGFAVLDVDYAGSTGYGRAYRRRLEGHWGVQDVADMIAAGDHLEREGLADGARLVISGGSAGGYTVLMTLAASRRFAVGSCSYGISDLSLLLAHTHKFESGYLHRLMGTTPDDWQATFEARSPIALADQIAAPLILFQGREDKVVPPEQSRLISERLMRTGVTTEYWEFDGEGHGFRRAGTINSQLSLPWQPWAPLAIIRAPVRFRLIFKAVQKSPVPRCIALKAGRARSHPGRIIFANIHINQRTDRRQRSRSANSAPNARMESPAHAPDVPSLGLGSPLSDFPYPNASCGPNSLQFRH
jgi:dienelactone hydrolase